MTYLAATAGIAGVLCSFNLLLTFILIRRVNGHAEWLARRRPGPGGYISLPADTAISPLTVPTVSGGTYSLGGRNGNRSLVAFLSPGCSACHDQLPELRDYARKLPGGAAEVLAVVVTRGQSNTTDFVHQLTAWASVTLEPPQGAAQKAFSVAGYPSYFSLAPDGKIEVGAVTVRHLAAAAQPA